MERITAADGHSFDAWRSVPEGRAIGGIVVLQAIYGLTDHLGDVCDRFATDGFHAIAPALYDRTERGRTFGYDPHDTAVAVLYRENLREATVLLDVAACRDALRSDGLRVAVSGFCTGGTWAWVSAAELEMDAAVIFYGTDVYEHIGRRPACPTMLHYGDRDIVVPMAHVEAIRNRHPECPMWIYPGVGHAFYNPEQVGYDAASAELAHERSVAFLTRCFAGRDV